MFSHGQQKCTVNSSRVSVNLLNTQFKIGMETSRLRKELNITTKFIPFEKRDKYDYIYMNHYMIFLT